MPRPSQICLYAARRLCPDLLRFACTLPVGCAQSISDPALCWPWCILRASHIRVCVIYIVSSAPLTFAPPSFVCVLLCMSRCYFARVSWCQSRVSRCQSCVSWCQSGVSRCQFISRPRQPFACSRQLFACSRQSVSVVVSSSVPMANESLSTAIRIIQWEFIPWQCGKESWVGCC